MVILWRRFVVWMRSLLLAIYLQKPIQWSDKLNDLFSIILDVLKQKETSQPDKPTEPTSPTKPTTPVAISNQPVRNFFRKLLSR